MQWHSGHLKHWPWGGSRRPKPQLSPDLSHSSKSSDTSTTGSISPHYDDKRDVVLQIESISDKMTKRISAVVYVAELAALGLLIAGAVLELSKSNDFFLHNRGLYIFNTVLAAMQVVALLIAGAIFTRRLIRSSATGKRWSLRRLRSVEVSAAEQALQWINSVLFLATNANFLANECTWFTPSVYWTAFFRLSVANSIFFLIVVQVVNMLPATGRHGEGQYSYGSILVTFLPCLPLPLLLFLSSF